MSDCAEQCLAGHVQNNWKHKKAFMPMACWPGMAKSPSCTHIRYTTTDRGLFPVVCFIAREERKRICDQIATANVIFKRKPQGFLRVFSFTIHVENEWMGSIPSSANNSQHQHVCRIVPSFPKSRDLQQQRVDHLLYALLKIAHYLVYKPLGKAEVGKLTHRRCEINKRH